MSVIHTCPTCGAANEAATPGLFQCGKCGATFQAQSAGNAGAAGTGAAGVVGVAGRQQSSEWVGASGRMRSAGRKATQQVVVPPWIPWCGYIAACITGLGTLLPNVSANLETGPIGGSTTYLTHGGYPVMLMAFAIGFCSFSAQRGTRRRWSFAGVAAATVGFSLFVILLPSEHQVSPGGFGVDGVTANVGIGVIISLIGGLIACLPAAVVELSPVDNSTGS